MKNIIFIIALLFSIAAFSQENYPNKRPQLLVGKTVKVIPMSAGMLRDDCGYRYFYTDPKCYKIYKGCDMSRSEAAALSNREFKVTAMNEGKGYQSILYIYIPLKILQIRKYYTISIILILKLQTSIRLKLLAGSTCLLIFIVIT